MVTEMTQYQHPLTNDRCPYGKDYICILGIRYQLWPGFKPGDCSRPHELDRDDLLFRGQCYCLEEVLEMRTKEVPNAPGE